MMSKGEIGQTEILLVEDDEDSAEMIQLFLERNGYRTMWTPSGQRAVEIVRDRHAAHEPAPDLILLDLTLPDLDGIEVAEQIAHESDPRPPIVITSARLNEDLQQAAKTIGAAACARKPFSLHALLSMIRGLVHERAHPALEGI